MELEIRIHIQCRRIRCIYARIVNEDDDNAGRIVNEETDDDDNAGRIVNEETADDDDACRVVNEDADDDDNAGRIVNEETDDDDTDAGSFIAAPRHEIM
jgi:hypothetical protein